MACENIEGEKSIGTKDIDEKMKNCQSKTQGKRKTLKLNEVLEGEPKPKKSKEDHKLVTKDNKTTKDTNPKQDPEAGVVDGPELGEELALLTVILAGLMCCSRATQDTL